MSISKTATFLFLICTCFVGYDAWDRIATWGFRSIFLYADEKAVWKLTFMVNHLDTSLHQYKIVRDWSKMNFKTKDAILNKNNKLSDQLYAEEQAWEFLRQRDAMRKFLRYMFRTTIDTNYFTEEEAVRMRDIWWKSDRDSQSNFTKTRPLFKNRTVTEFAKSHKDFAAKFENLTGDYYYSHVYSAQSLNWTLIAE